MEVDTTMEEGRSDQMKLLLQAVDEVTDKVEEKVVEAPPVVLEERPEDLEGCEKLIEGSSLKNNFLSIGQALVTINDRKLYKDAGCTSFTQYIEQKGDFGFGPRQALRLLAATRLVRNFPPSICLPSSERQVRALVGLEQAEAIKVWTKATTISLEKNIPLTHRLVESVLGKELPTTYRQVTRDWQDYVSPDSEYYVTPAPILAAVRKLFGGPIDLDPASDERANEVVKALKYYTAEQDGLAEDSPWAGKVFINPPYGVIDKEPVQGLFLQRALREVASGAVAEAVLLLKAAVGQRWFGPVFGQPHCWLSDKAQKKASGKGGGGGGGAGSGRSGGGGGGRGKAAVKKEEGSDEGAEGGEGLGGGGRKGSGGGGGGGKAAAAAASTPRGMVVVYVGRRVKDFCTNFKDLGHIPGYSGSWAADSRQQQGGGGRG
ncbi:hypothetical protein HYH02_002622 [Chlamydomonas schloesseri]|uniref:Uncharacterized protein n=1 Tax=Chlamydomonas schloesseri TaxID=2026947 RepID=A0A836BA57_9CHLO|nr:hypothetical protein HYH02_002622 [Chlamydomonas schloesseri]|eukprot:KAG2452376.1 hypothetical protein HYH02_002622 [Chlamydomonas schloesseri]